MVFENYAKTTGRTGRVVTVVMLVVIDTRPIARLPAGGIAKAVVAGVMWLIRLWHRHNCRRHRDEVEHLLHIARHDTHH